MWIISSIWFRGSHDKLWQGYSYRQRNKHEQEATHEYYVLLQKELKNMYDMTDSTWWADHGV